MPYAQTMTQFPNGIAQGIILRGMPILQAQPGRVFWVYNGSTLLPGQVAGSDNNRGSYYRPFSTIAGALTQCTAGAGDIVFVKPGHAETISSASILSLNKAGVAIIGLGTGSLRPTLTFSTAASANIPVTAANMSIQNILFVANVADVTSVFTATSTNTPTDFNIDNCEFRDTSSALNFITIFTGNATANSCSGFMFTKNRISSLGTTAATTAIKLNSASHDRVSINDNFGNWAVLNDTAAMLAVGANNITNFEFARNVINRPNTSTTSGLAISTSGTAWTGQCYGNMIWGLDNSAQIWIDTGTKLAFNQNFCPITSVADKSGLINPAAV